MTAVTPVVLVAAFPDLRYESDGRNGNSTALTRKVHFQQVGLGSYLRVRGGYLASRNYGPSELHAYSIELE
jgi:hypothetical protein